jgi:pimeloyl-ACP methyl ester carboxylesterase
MRRRGQYLTRLLVALAMMTTACNEPDSTRESSSSRFVPLGELSIHYEDYGAGATALVFVHCWTCNGTFWRHQIEEFSDEIRSIAIDLPGHGQSDKPDVTYTVELFAQALDAVLQDASIDAAVLVGHSMGTPVILQYALAHPETVRALVLLDGPVTPFSPGARDFIETLKTDYEGATDDVLLPQESFPELRAEVQATMLKTPSYVAASAFEGMLDWLDGWEPKMIRVPVLAIYASSVGWGPETEDTLVQIVPQLDYQEWDDVSHYIMMEKPRELNSALQSFLDHVL